MSEPRICANPACGAEVSHLLRGLCGPCYQWQKRHGGAMRPEEVVITYVRRRDDYFIIRAAKRAQVCADALAIPEDEFVRWCECERRPGHGPPHRGWIGEWSWRPYANLVLESRLERSLPDVLDHIVSGV